jgi:hypothetical protein
MTYKFTTGSVRRGDIYFEDDDLGAATYIDFGMDTIILRPSGAAALCVENGAVGVGTQNPTQNLHVFGTTNTTLRIQGPPGSYGALNVKGGTGDSAWVWQPANTSELRFFTVDDDRMTILGTGEVGINTNSPAAALDINANAMRLRNSKTPASAVGTAGDVQGMIVWDVDFIYICTGNHDGLTNIWKRARINTW